MGSQAAARGGPRPEIAWTSDLSRMISWMFRKWDPVTLKEWAVIMFILLPQLALLPKLDYPKEAKATCCDVRLLNSKLQGKIFQFILEVPYFLLGIRVSS